MRTPMLMSASSPLVSIPTRTLLTQAALRERVETLLRQDERLIRSFVPGMEPTGFRVQGIDQAAAIRFTTLLPSITSRSLVVTPVARLFSVRPLFAVSAPVSVVAPVTPSVPPTVALLVTAKELSVASPEVVSVVVLMPPGKLTGPVRFENKPDGATWLNTPLPSATTMRW